MCTLNLTEKCPSYNTNRIYWPKYDNFEYICTLK